MMDTSSRSRQLLIRLKAFVREETAAQKQALSRQWARPLRERVATGHAIEGLMIEKVRPDGTAALTCHSNNSRFREGDFLILHRGDPEGPDAIRCVLEFEEETYLEVRLDGAGVSPLLEENYGWIIDEGMLDLTFFYLDALDHAADSLRGREIILPLLDGKKSPMVDYARYERGCEIALEAGLNESQAEAAGQAYASDLVHLIQGPPGTGKTYVLAQLAQMFVEEGRRVLVTALTHRAINNALNKIYALDPALPVCKIGQTPGAKGLEVPNYRYFDSSEFVDLAGGYIIGATPFATRTRRLANVEFDVMLCDEASQITLPLAIMGMLACERYIFIGDEQQLPPVTSSKASKAARTSIFSFLDGRGYETMLTTTYRLNDRLANWPSRMFYENKLVPAPEIANRRLSLGDKPSPWDFALNPEDPVVFLDLLHRNTSVRGRVEAEVVSDLIYTLIQKGVSPQEIGVVTPYRAQARTIRNFLGKLMPDKESYRGLVVDTVERMQGQEREVVLVSLTTSNPAFAAQIGDFYFQPERLNVAITRPRTKLIVVGSRQVLKAQEYDPELAPRVSLFESLMNFSTSYTLPDGRPA